MAKVLLLDGNSLLYRGFFAMRMLTTSDNIPTNAIYSMCLMLLSALDTLKPDSVVCAFDAPVATFRHEAFDAYKGTRQPVPDELAMQRPLARDLMQAFNIPQVEIASFEADDSIGTLAVKAQREGHSVMIVTGDLDALQLVDDRGPIEVLTTIRGVTETIVYDETKVRERYGLRPDQIPDYKALKGDPSDNLPGIPGIGDKTATKILTQYGSVEALVAAVNDITDPKLRQLIQAHGQDALLFKDLASIRRNIPLGGFEFSLDFQTRGIDIPAATEFFESLEFRTLIKRLGSKPVTYGIKDPSSTIEASERITATVRSAMSAILLEFDITPDKADFLNDAVMAIHVSPGAGVDLPPLSPLSSSPHELPEKIVALLQEDAVPKIVHDKKLTEGALQSIGVTLRAVAFDTMLAGYLINPGRGSYRLPDLLRDYSGVDLDASEAPSADHLRLLEPALSQRLFEAGLNDLFYKIELPLASILGAMERTGVAVDVARLKSVSIDLDVQIQQLEKAIYALAGGEPFAIGSTKQLQTVLFEKLALPSGKKTKSGNSTNAEVLEMLAAQGYAIAEQITSWRELSKLKSTYADNLQNLVSPHDGRIHTSLNQTVTATGRLSSSNPNLQNIPIRTEIGREIRKSFVAGPGMVLLAADYSQIELRIFAHMTRDPELMRTFQADEDIHRRTASLIFHVDQTDVTSIQRRRAKTINFAVIYGMSDFRLAGELGIDIATARDWKKQYFAEYPGVNAFAAKTLEQARAVGYVKTLLGRRRYTPDISSLVFQFRQAAEREAVNMPVQGTAADIMKLAMIDVNRALRESGVEARMTLQVHDELVFECKPDHLDLTSQIVASCMEGAYSLSVRLKVELRQGPNWSDMSPMVNVLDTKSAEVA